MTGERSLDMVDRPLHVPAKALVPVRDPVASTRASGVRVAGKSKAAA